MDCSFRKYHANKNDFIVLNFEGLENHDLSSLTKKLCDRRSGIGADGLLFIINSNVASAKMRIFNSDGSEGEMCGNGLICFIKTLYDENQIDFNSEVNIETCAGIKRATLINEGSDYLEIKTNLGRPKRIDGNIKKDGFNSLIKVMKVSIDEVDFTLNCINTGVPHAIIFLENEKCDNISFFEMYGPLIETHYYFPEKINVMFTEVVNQDLIRIAPWERGAGRTFGCGTGSAAAGVISFLTGRCTNPVEVKSPGGSSVVKIETDGSISLQSRAYYSFTGMVKL